MLLSCFDFCFDIFPFPIPPARVVLYLICPGRAPPVQERQVRDHGRAESNGHYQGLAGAVANGFAVHRKQEMSISECVSCLIQWISMLFCIHLQTQTQALNFQALTSESLLCMLMQQCDNLLSNTNSTYPSSCIGGFIP